MRQIYLRVEDNSLLRKVAIDMASLFSHKKIRLPKFYFEEGLYIPFKEKNGNGMVDKYFLTRDKIVKEDNDFYYFDFPFDYSQIENTAN